MNSKCNFSDGRYEPDFQQAGWFILSDLSVAFKRHDGQTRSAKNCFIFSTCRPDQHGREAAAQ